MAAKVKKFKHTIELTIRNDQGEQVRSWQIIYLQVAIIFLLIGIVLTWKDLTVSLRYWLFDWQPDPFSLLVFLLPIQVGYAPG